MFDSATIDGDTASKKMEEDGFEFDYSAAVDMGGSDGKSAADGGAGGRRGVDNEDGDIDVDAI
jgi:hypothetical protein